MKFETDAEFRYVGAELDVFAQAARWKDYWSTLVRPYCRGVVWEVGAGLGANTPRLINPAVTRWVCVEPDAVLAARLCGAVTPDGHHPVIEIHHGTTRDVPSDRRPDVILYIDVLEHIEQDGEELSWVADQMAGGGRLVVLSPAHGWLFSPFDVALGHFRRYNRKMLRAAVPASLREERLIYLDGAGMLASLANRLLLRQAYPTLDEILFWDRRLIPVSVALDRVFGYRLGKSLLGVFHA